MLYAVIATDVENSLNLRMQVREKHLARLHKLKEEDRLLIAGPHPLSDGKEGFSGSLVVAEFNSLQEAQEWADADPYFDIKAYKSVIVKPFKKVLP